MVMQEVQKLVRILEKELSYQEKLLTLLSKENKAIVKLNREEIEQLNTQKSAVIDSAKELELERASLIETISEQIKKKPEAPIKLQDIIASCRDTKLRAELATVGTDLKKTAEATQLLNIKNTILIRQSLGLVLSTISIMRSTPDQELPSYGADGEETKPQERRIPAAASPFTRQA
jgi:flagellar biosynthesis/type III secretory pathway chaperone